MNVCTKFIKNPLLYWNATKTKIQQFSINLILNLKNIQSKHKGGVNNSLHV